MATTPRRDPAWYDACAFCPPNGTDPAKTGQRSRVAGWRNVFEPGEPTTEVLYRGRIRRVHTECLPFALIRGCALADDGQGKNAGKQWQPNLF
jgi:hypothetical protein